MQSTIQHPITATRACIIAEILCDYSAEEGRLLLKHSMPNIDLRAVARGSVHAF